MEEKFIRVYQKLDVKKVKEHLLIHGDLSSSCGNCGELDLKLSDHACPKCRAEFKYISFRNVKNHLPKLQKISAERPSMVIVDFDDYQRISGETRAQNFFKD